MSEHTTSTPAPASADIPALPPDAENPALIFAKKTYIWLWVFAVGFIGAVVAFIL